jgi:hypothetical protein
MGKFIPVDPDRWAELVKAAGERDALVAENARLKAEVERLTKAGDAIYKTFDEFGQVDAMTLKGWKSAKEGDPTL